MKTGLKNSFFLLFMALFGMLGFALVSALSAWLERKIYKTTTIILENNKTTWLAQAEATTLSVVSRFHHNTEEEQL